MFYPRFFNYSLFLSYSNINLDIPEMQIAGELSFGYVKMYHFKQHMQ